MLVQEFAEVYTGGTPKYRRDYSAVHTLRNWKNGDAQNNTKGIVVYMQTSRCLSRFLAGQGHKNIGQIKNRVELFPLAEDLISKDELAKLGVAVATESLTPSALAEREVEIDDPSVNYGKAMEAALQALAKERHGAV